MSECLPDQRARLQRLARDLELLPSIRAVDVVVADPTHGVCLEVVVAPDRAGLPPRACERVAEHRATVADVSPRGEPSHAVAWLVVDR